MHMHMHMHMHMAPTHLVFFKKYPVSRIANKLIYNAATIYREMDVYQHSNIII